jgi:hypothetical protein
MNITPQENNFFSTSQEVVRKFLHSVVAIDDDLCFGKKPDTAPSDEEVHSLKEPIENGLGEYSVDLAKTNNTNISHPLDYQLLASSFAKEGIVCSGLLITNIDRETKCNIINSSEKADITIIDWDMNNDKGIFAKEIIGAIAKNDKCVGGRLRMIAVYTGEVCENVSFQVEHFLRTLDFKTLRKNNNIKIVDDNELTHWLVTIINKEIPPDKLPEKLIYNFTNLTLGLLSNAAISCISEIRNKTHSILSKYNNTLDTAYVSQVLGLISLRDSRALAHENANDYAVELISEEIKALLQVSSKLKETLTKKILLDWPIHYYENNGKMDFRIKVKGEPIIITPQQLTEIISSTSEDDLSSKLSVLKIKQNPKSTLNVLIKEFSKSFNDHNLDIIKGILSHNDTIADLEFINLSMFTENPISLSIGKEGDDKIIKLCALENARRTLKNTQNDKFMTLKMGTILRDENDMFYICMQPLCDSVRLSGESNFIFVQGRKTKSGYNYVIENNLNGIHKFKIDTKSKNIINMRFLSDDNIGMVKADRDDVGNYIFYPDHANFDQIEKVYSPIPLYWVGELKFNIAQKLSNEISSNLSRVGIDQHEWMRIKTK